MRGWGRGREKGWDVVILFLPQGNLSNFQRICASLKVTCRAQELSWTYKYRKGFFFFFGGRRGWGKAGKIPSRPVGTHLPLFTQSRNSGLLSSSLPLTPPLPWEQRTRPPKWCWNPPRCTRHKRPTTLRAEFYLLGYPWRTRCLWSPGNCWLQKNKEYLLSERRVGGDSAVKLLQSLPLLLGSSCTHTILHNRLCLVNNNVSSTSMTANV